MMIKCIRFTLAFFLLLVLLSTASVSAQNKAVVIPLMGDGPLAPYSPLAAESPPNSAYTIESNVVKDNVTGLWWQKEDDNTTKNWDEAENYCQALSLGGKDDWRLPSVAELISIIYYGTYEPAINSIAFPGTEVGGCRARGRHTGRLRT